MTVRDLARRLEAAEAEAERLVRADGPVLPWHVLSVETRLSLLEAMDECEDEDELASLLDRRPDLRDVLGRVLDAAG